MYVALRIRLHVSHLKSEHGLEDTEQIIVQAIVQCKSPLVDKHITFLVDTGACHTTILDRDAKRLKIDYEALSPLPQKAWTRGVGGLVETFQMSNVHLKFLSEDRKSVLLDAKLPSVNVLKHPKERYNDVREFPSLLGMDFIRDYRLIVSASGDEAYLEKLSTGS